MQTDLPFVTAPWLQAYFTPVEQHSPDMKEALRLSEELVDEILRADRIVTATPVYNYNVPAVINAGWTTSCARGRHLGGQQRFGHWQEATVLLASGSVYTEGSPIHDRDIATQYLRLILEVTGDGCSRWRRKWLIWRADDRRVRRHARSNR